MPPAPSTPVELPWADAPRRILDAASTHLNSRPAVVIGITGPVGSGKSTLAAALSACIVRTDDYLPDYEGIAYLERDRAEHSDLARLATDLSMLRSGSPAHAPIWSFHTHRRDGERRIEAASIIVCEGLHALHSLITPHLDLRIFVEAPPHIRWSRWEHLARTGQRGWDVAASREFFDRVAEPTFNAAAAAYRAHAHFIVRNDGT